jgi:hypothetical protein
MPMAFWIWLMVAAAIVMGLSLVVALVVARALGAIGREVNELLERAESQVWSTRPLLREGRSQAASAETRSKRITVPS